jgi:hypothetical protein
MEPFKRKYDLSYSKNYTILLYKRICASATFILKGSLARRWHVCLEIKMRFNIGFKILTSPMMCQVTARTSFDVWTVIIGLCPPSPQPVFRVGVLLLLTSRAVRQWRCFVLLFIHFFRNRHWDDGPSPAVKHFRVWFLQRKHWICRLMICVGKQQLYIFRSNEFCRSIL